LIMMAMDRRTEKRVKEICDWLFHRMQQCESQEVVVGINGDIDSAVAAALARKALGGNVLGLLMSCHGTPSDMEDARLVVKHLALRYEWMDLSSAHDLFLSMFPEAPSGGDMGIEPWLRTLVLRHYAASRNRLVLGTGNRSDWEIGCVSKYDDAAADLFPLIHLLRTDVCDIARHLRLPHAIIEKADAETVWTGPTSESEPSIGYRELDAYLSGNVTVLPETLRNRISTLHEAAGLRKRPHSKFSLLNGMVEKEAFFTDGQEAYDKSIEALTLISKAITSDQFLEDILRLIVMVTAEVMNSSVCSLWLLDEKEGVLRLRATQSIDKEYLKDRVLKVGEGVVGKVVAENRPYVATNVLVDPFFKEKELARRMRLVSMLSIPMRVKDRVIGVINCYTSHPHVFSDLQMNVLTAVANQAAVAIEKTELMVQTRVIQEELEKRKIIERAKDLLMKRLELSGEEAYRWLQKRSMNTRKSMREVSEAVLLTMEG